MPSAHIQITAFLAAFAVWWLYVRVHRVPAIFQIVHAAAWVATLAAVAVGRVYLGVRRVHTHVISLHTVV